MGYSELSLLRPARLRIPYFHIPCANVWFMVASLVGDVDDPLPLRGGQQGLVVLQPGLQLVPHGGGHGDGLPLHLG